MKAAQLKVSYDLTGPANWKGKYTSNNEFNSPNWTWYKDGDNRLTNYPHITLAFNETWEVDKNGEWVGFHVSYPLSKSGKNARFNYAIKNGVVTFSNMTRKGFTDQALAEAEEIANDKWSDIDAFAKAFYSAAANA